MKKFPSILEQYEAVYFNEGIGIIKSLMALGLEEITTYAQHKRGTVMFKDTKFKNHPKIEWVHYTLHWNGYVRRTIKYKLISKNSMSYGYSYYNYENYQLNLKNPDSGDRIMINGLKNQMIFVISNVLHYRKKYSI